MVIHWFLRLDVAAALFPLRLLQGSIVIVSLVKRELSRF
jgi:hypothetical protein